MLPHQDKKAKGGEDAVVASDTLLCVCDGVGGWSTQGVDPADYSRGLAKNIEKIYTNTTDGKVYGVKDKPNQLLVEAVSETRVIGSTTCVMAMIDQSKAIVHTSNLGDSSYLWLRKQGLDLDKLY